MSVGYNVQFDSKLKTIVSIVEISNQVQKFQEAHILKRFDKDFYESKLEGIALQYIRPMRAFSSLSTCFVLL